MTVRPESVRFATIDDEGQIMKLMEAAFVEQPIFPLNKMRMRETLRRCTTPHLKDRRGMIAVVGEPGKLEGYLIALIAQYWYTDAMHLEELSNFVHPDHRLAWKGHARNLIEFAKWFAESLDIPLIMGILSTQRLEGKTRLYKRQVKLCGAIFVHNTGHLGDILSERG